MDEKALRIVFVGHVDHGKSTLVGRLMHETGSVLPEKIKYVEAICREKHMRFEYAFLLDALEEEQDQGVTIDVSQVIFKTRKRSYRVIDAPGHKEFLKNMVSGAAGAEAAILTVDAEEGLREQSKRHATILSLLGIRSVLVAVNKMDLIGYRREVFESIREEYKTYLSALKIAPVGFVPVSGYEGDNINKRSAKMDWYDGKTLAELLDSLEPYKTSEARPLRFPLQDVYRFDRRRIYAGRLESGQVSSGDELLFLPSKKTGIVKSIERWSAPASSRAYAGESVGITLEEQIFVERGEVACTAAARPRAARSFSANIFWMGDRHLRKGSAYRIKLTTQEIDCKIKEVRRVINSSTLDEVSQKSREVAKNEVAEIVIECKKDVVFDTFDRIEETGRFVLVDGNRVSGGGIILKK